VLVKAICQEFGVREEWLRTGKGPRLREDLHLTDDLEAEVVRRVREREVEELAGVIKEAAKGYQAGLPDDERELLEDYRTLAEEKALVRGIVHELAERRRRGKE
jgi:signal transduction protein with GAF and PtsI domain